MRQTSIFTAKAEIGGTLLTRYKELVAAGGAPARAWAYLHTGHNWPGLATALASLGYLDMQVRTSLPPRPDQEATSVVLPQAATAPFRPGDATTSKPKPKPTPKPRPKPKTKPRPKLQSMPKLKPKANNSGRTRTLPATSQSSSSTPTQIRPAHSSSGGNARRTSSSACSHRPPGRPPDRRRPRPKALVRRSPVISERSRQRK